jgi:hypothetical protein
MIQDYSIEVSTDQSFTSSGDYPYIPSTKTIKINTLSNLLIDIGSGSDLVMEFEVTKSFTGHLTSTGLFPWRIPQIQLCVAVGIEETLTINPTIIGNAGWQLGNAPIENGLQPSDSGIFPNLFAGDKYYVKIPPFVLGLPWIGTSSNGITYTRSKNVIPGSGYIGAYYILPNRENQLVQMSNSSIWTATNFTAGAIKTRILIDTSVSGGKHHYAAGMQVK